MNTVGDLGEFGLIRRLARVLPTTPAVLEGIGDDCAVLRYADRLLLVSSDLFVEDVHFRRSMMGPEEIGWKAAAAAISDVAAMGGAPLFSLVSLACEGGTDVAFVESVYRGMANVFSQYGGVIVGGDTSRCTGPMVLDVTVIGEVSGNRCLRRRGALPGDVIAVTGYPGLSAAGLDALERGKDQAELTQRHRWPRPRIREGQWLCARPEVHAMLDTSDGLVQDAEHIAEASGLGIDIESARVPIAPILARHCEEYGLDAQALILTGGEDYELAFTMGAENHEETLRALNNEFRTVVTVVGRCTDEWTGVRVDGREPDVGGFDHFLNRDE
ncbi:MAG: thiamine-phosphate kinase [Candidatus Hydrogenedentes bacterium]|nr:thiamine-phosphate kinase [Candidatus Hydrogenedentota bacterium]